MIPAAIYGAAGAAVISCAAYAASCLPERYLRTPVLRARWAWRCRGRPPVPDDGERLTFEEAKALGGIISGPERPERSRT